MPVVYPPKGEVRLGNIIFRTSGFLGIGVTLTIIETDAEGNTVNTWYIEKDTDSAIFDIKMEKNGENYDIYVDNAFICSIPFIKKDAVIYVDKGGNYPRGHNWKWYDIICE